MNFDINKVLYYAALPVILNGRTYVTLISHLTGKRVFKSTVQLYALRFLYSIHVNKLVLAEVSSNLTFLLNTSKVFTTLVLGDIIVIYNYI